MCTLSARKRALHCWCFLYHNLIYLSLNHRFDKQNRVSYEAELTTLQSLSWLLPELPFFKSSEHLEQDFMTHGGLLLSHENIIFCPHTANFLCLCILEYFMFRLSFLISNSYQTATSLGFLQLYV